ncbi:MAG: hypothetical protein WKF73_19810 [Nocardioidaceae bacterium]
MPAPAWWLTAAWPGRARRSASPGGSRSAVFPELLRAATFYPSPSSRADVLAAFGSVARASEKN